MPLTQPEEALITADSLCVNRNGKAILNHVSLSIGEHDFVTVIGPNGAGKSILLKCLLGLQTASSGTISQKSRLKTGYVPQRFSAEKTMPLSVKRFLTLGRYNHQQASLERAIEETSISHLLQRPLDVLSGGEMQRVLLARALMNEPELLVLDEPAQNLDITGQLAFYKLLNEIYTTRRLSILMVSHDLHLVMASTKQVVCLFHHICCSGEPHIVAKDPEFIALFGKDMSEMLAVYHHSHDHSHEHDHDHATNQDIG